MTVDAPICKKHCGYWWKRQLLMWLPLLLLFIGGSAAVIAAGDAGAGEKNVAGFICIGTAGLFIAWLIVAVVIQTKLVRPAEITDRTITLKRVNEKFLDAFEEMRRERRRDFDREYDDVEDYDERMCRRRERQAKDDSGYDDDRRERFRAERDPDKPPDERIRPAD